MTAQYTETEYKAHGPSRTQPSLMPCCRVNSSIVPFAICASVKTGGRERGACYGKWAKMSESEQKKVWCGLCEARVACASARIAHTCPTGVQ